MWWKSFFISTMVVGAASLLSACQDTGSGAPSEHFAASEYVALLQVALSSLPGGNMDAVKSALDKQQNPRCQLQTAEADGGVRLEVVTGAECPLHVEYETFGNVIEFDTGILRFNENLLYVEHANGGVSRAGLELHSQYAFHMDMDSETAAPKKVVVTAKAKHLSLGELKLMGEVRFEPGVDGQSERVLDYMIANDKVSSRIEIDFVRGTFRVDGREIQPGNEPTLFRFTVEPDLNRPFQKI